VLENVLENQLSSLDQIKDNLRTKFKRLGKSQYLMDGALFSSSKPAKFKGLYKYCSIMDTQRPNATKGWQTMGRRARMVVLRTTVSSLEEVQDEGIQVHAL
jgi:hypothetical protein